MEHTRNSGLAVLPVFRLQENSFFVHFHKEVDHEEVDRTNAFRPIHSPYSV